MPPKREKQGSKAPKPIPKVAPNAPSGEPLEMEGSSEVDIPFRVFLREVERALLAGEPLSSGVQGTLVDMLRKNDEKETGRFGDLLEDLVKKRAAKPLSKFVWSALVGNLQTKARTKVESLVKEAEDSDKVLPHLKV